MVLRIDMHIIKGANYTKLYNYMEGAKCEFDHNNDKNSHRFAHWKSPYSYLTIYQILYNQTILLSIFIKIIIIKKEKVLKCLDYILIQLSLSYE